MITKGIYRHTYTSTASDITLLYRLTTNADGIVVCELMSQWQPQPVSSDVSEVLNRTTL